MYARVFTKEGSCGAPQNILGLGPLKTLIRPWLARVARAPPHFLDYGARRIVEPQFFYHMSLPQNGTEAHAHSMT